MTTKKYSHFTNFGVSIQPSMADSCGFIAYRPMFESRFMPDKWTAGERWIHSQEERLNEWRSKNGY